MKTALVTGGSRGIGRATALELGKNFHVVVGFANSEDKANDVVKEIIATGGSASTVQIDISSAKSVDDAFTNCLLYTYPSPRDKRQSRMPSSA